MPISRSHHESPTVGWPAKGSSVAGVTIRACAVLAPPALVALLAAPLAVRPIQLVRNNHDAPSLVAALIGTVRFQLVLAALLAVGLVLD